MNLSILIPSKDEPKIHDMIAETEAQFPQAQIIICNDRDGRGKGWAVRTALAEATGDVICFIDGDLDIHPSQIKRLIPFIADYDVVVGEKMVRGSRGRRWVTRLSRIYLHLFFGFDYDTQTGIKLFRRYSLLPWHCDNFMFDLEILCNARRKGLQIINVPVEVTDYGSSSKPMRFRHIIKCLRESLNIWFDQNVTP